mgnify:CR=1 FL=1
MKHSDLVKRIEELERRVKELTEAPTEQHRHFRPPVYEYSIPQYTRPPVLWWDQTWCGASNTTTSSTVSAASFPNITYTA